VGCVFARLLSAQITGIDTDKTHGKIPGAWMKMEIPEAATMQNE